MIQRIHGETVKAMAQDDTPQKLFDAGAFPIGDTPEQFAAQIEAEMGKWAAVATFAKVETTE